MVNIIGKYQHERSDNIDAYFKSLGVPYLVRKMMGISNPRLEITKDSDDKWSIKNISMMRTQTSEFVLDTEYEEVMTSGVILKNTTTLKGDSLITISKTEDGNKVIRRYDPNEGGIVLTMSHDRSDEVAKRYFKRLE